MTDALHFDLDGHDYVEFKNLLKLCGLCESGGEAKAAIDESQVQVDGAIETRKACKIKAGQIVVFKGKTIQVKAKK
jgi:ribosome-associated protein